ncbi:MAG: arsenate reductase ArsC [Bacillota bacterium]
MSGDRLKVLFLCTANSSRSQMAEGLARALRAADVEAHSAGSDPASVNPYAVQAMAEAGIDISGQRAKHVHEFLGQPFDLVVTLCDSAREACPVFPGAKAIIHRGFPDPAAAQGSPEEVLAEFRRVRDMLREFILQLP